jgi:DNA-binding IclR family transcriptional regulator
MELSRSTESTVLLAVPAGPDVICVEKLHGRKKTPISMQIGAREPALDSALGLAILSRSSADVVKSAVRGSRCAGARPARELQSVRARLQSLGANGVVIDHGFADSCVTIAAPVVDRCTDYATAAVSVTISNTDSRRSSVTRELVRAVHGIALAA